MALLLPYQMGEAWVMSGVALAMFVGLFAWGSQIVGYDDPHGHVQIALLMTFSFGLLIGYRARA